MRPLMLKFLMVWQLLWKISDLPWVNQHLRLFVKPLWKYQTSLGPTLEDWKMSKKNSKSWFNIQWNILKSFCNLVCNQVEVFCSMDLLDVVKLCLPKQLPTNVKPILLVLRDPNCLPCGLESPRQM